MECQYKLMRYGIPQCILPIDPSGNLKQAQFASWIEQLKKDDQMIEANDGCGLFSTDSVLKSHEIPPNDIRPNDVLRGRGLAHLTHPGNARLARIIDAQRHEYSTTSKFEKTCIIMRIVADVKKWNGRFLDRSKKGSTTWVELSDEQARRAVVDRFRRKGLISQNDVA